jgi:hypothetical protein
MQACSFAGDVRDGHPTPVQSETSEGNAYPILSLMWLFPGKNA